MTTAPTLATELLRESTAWRLLCLLFECPVGSWHSHVRELGAAVDDPALREAAEKALEEADEGLYHSAFGPGGPAAPREVSYSDSVQLGYLISELEAYYAAFAYQPGTREAADHISVEAGFVSYLFLKQAYAETSGDAEAALVVADARTQFLREHLAWVAEPLAGRLKDSPLDYLVLAGESLAGRVGPSRERRPLPQSVLPVISEDNEFRCGEPQEDQ